MQEAETPSVTEAAIKIQEFGGQGITIHPRPDERHITRKDVYDLKPWFIQNLISKEILIVRLLIWF